MVMAGARWKWAGREKRSDGTCLQEWAWGKRKGHDWATEKRDEGQSGSLDQLPRTRLFCKVPSQASEGEVQSRVLQDPRLGSKKWGLQ